MSLNQYRELKGFTQEYMAKNLGISIAAYSMYENGKRKIPRNAADKIGKLLLIPKEDMEYIFLPACFAICKIVEKNINDSQ